MSPTIFAFPANEFAGDFQAFFLAGAKQLLLAAPVGVIVMGPPRCSISSQQGKALGPELSRTHYPGFHRRYHIVTMVKQRLDGDLRQRAIQRAQHRFRLARGLALAPPQWPLL